MIVHITELEKNREVERNEQETKSEEGQLG